MSNVFDDLTQKSEGEKYSFLKDKLFKKDKDILNFITELSKYEINIITVLDFENKFIMEEFGIDMGFTDLTNELKELMISFNRKGRTRAEEVMISDTLNEAKKRGFLGNFMGQR